MFHLFLLNFTSNSKVTRSTMQGFKLPPEKALSQIFQIFSETWRRMLERLRIENMWVSYSPAVCVFWSQLISYSGPHQSPPSPAPSKKSGYNGSEGGWDGFLQRKEADKYDEEISGLVRYQTWQYSQSSGCNLGCSSRWPWDGVASNQRFYYNLNFRTS